MTRTRPAFLPSDLGETRTILASDRTLMAWIRTSLSMLSFGFTIYKFLKSIAAPDPAKAAMTAEVVGLFLAGTGTAAIIFGTIGYWATLKELQRVEEFRLRRPVLLLALIMSVAGIALFIAIAGNLV